MRESQMLNLILATEPPTPTPPDTPDFVPSPMIYIAVILVVAGIVAWKYKLIWEFIAVLCSTIAGFIIGFVATPPYANVGLGMVIALAALFLSAAIVTVLKLAQKTKRTIAVPSK